MNENKLHLPLVQKEEGLVHRNIEPDTPLHHRLKEFYLCLIPLQHWTPLQHLIRLQRCPVQVHLLMDQFNCYTIQMHLKIISGRFSN